MTRDNIINEVRSLLREPIIAPAVDGKFFLNIELCSWYNFGKNDLCSFSEVYKKVGTTITSVKDQPNYNLPTDFIRMIDVRYDGVKLVAGKRRDMDTGYKDWSLTTVVSSTPKIYYFYTPKIIGIYPPPDTAGKNVIIFYIAKDIDLVSTGGDITINIDDTYIDAIIEYILSRAEKKNGNENVSEFHYNNYLRKREEAKRYAKRLDRDQIYSFQPSARNKYL